MFALSDEITPVQMQRNNIKFLTKASGGSFKMYLDEIQETGKGSSGDSFRSGGGGEVGLRGGNPAAAE